MQIFCINEEITLINYNRFFSVEESTSCLRCFMVLLSSYRSVGTLQRNLPEHVVEGLCILFCSATVPKPPKASSYKWGGEIMIKTEPKNILRS